MVEDVAQLVSQHHAVPPREVELEARDVIVRVAALGAPGRGPRDVVVTGVCDDEVDLIADVAAQGRALRERGRARPAEDLVGQPRRAGIRHPAVQVELALERLERLAERQERARVPVSVEIDRRDEPRAAPERRAARQHRVTRGRERRGCDVVLNALCRQQQEYAAAALGIRDRELTRQGLRNRRHQRGVPARQ